MEGKTVEEILRENELKIQKQKEHLSQLFHQEKCYNFDTKEFTYNKCSNNCHVFNVPYKVTYQLENNKDNTKGESNTNIDNTNNKDKIASFIKSLNNNLVLSKEPNEIKGDNENNKVIEKEKAKTLEKETTSSKVTPFIKKYSHSDSDDEIEQEKTISNQDYQKFVEKIEEEVNTIKYQNNDICNIIENKPKTVCSNKKCIQKSKSVNKNKTKLNINKFNKQKTPSNSNHNTITRTLPSSGTKAPKNFSVKKFKTSKTCNFKSPIHKKNNSLSNSKKTLNTFAQRPISCSPSLIFEKYNYNLNHPKRKYLLIY